jgi:hypothetical protein
MSRRRTTIVFSLLFVAIGTVVIARTLAAGVGGGLGLVVGVLFVLAGAARLYLSTR